MPPLGSREWLNWFQQQDEDTQQQMLFDFGLGDANQPIAGNDVGTMQPEIGTQSYGLLDQLSPPPVINSKGVIQPSGAEQVQKQTNLFQDQLSLGTDNMLAAIAGQFAPTAFTPTYEPQGNPVTQGGLQNLMNVANAGGWEGFMASQMLPEKYGGGGMNQGQAKRALVAAIKVPDDADQAALELREELRGSLPMRYETQGQSTNPQVTPVNKDLFTDQGIVNTFDMSDVDTVSRGWQKDLASDPVAGYTDPTTGLSYLGAKKNNTPTMDWFDKYGLPYANKSYADPDQIAGMQDAVAPWQYQGQGIDEQLQRQDALAANAAARKNLDLAQTDSDVLEKAYKQATGAGLAQDRQVPVKYNPANPMTSSVIVPDSSSNIPGPIVNGFSIHPGGLYSPPVNYDVVKRQIAEQEANGPKMDTIPGQFFADVDASGRPTGLSLDQSVPYGGTKGKDTKMGDLHANVNFDFGKPGTTVPGMDYGALEQLIPGLSKMTSDRKVMTAADLGSAKDRVAMARKAAAKTVPGIQATSKFSPTAFNRQMEQARMIGLSLTGRTPLSDTLAGRMMAARTAGVYQ